MKLYFKIKLNLICNIVSVEFQLYIQHVIVLKHDDTETRSYLPIEVILLCNMRVCVQKCAENEGV